MEVLSQFKGMGLFIEFFLKSAIILGLTLGAYYLAKKKSAAFKHLLLSLSFMILLILPVLTALAPTWHSNLFPSLSTNRQTDNYIETAPGAVIPVETRNMPATLFTVEASPRPTLLLFLQETYPYILIALWPLGLMLLLAKLVIGLYRTVRLTNRCTAMEGRPWKELFLSLVKKVSLKRKIRLLKNEGVVIPMTWGVRKPVIMLPNESGDWPMDHRTTVLYHELSHIKRGDFLVRILASVVCALYWYNPLSWIVFRQLKKEQEKACDEMVLKAGIKPSIYASCLLYMKKSIEKAKGRYVPAAAIGMAGKSEFKERLTAILKKQRNSKEEKMKSKITLIVLAIFVAAIIGTAKPTAAPPASDHAEAGVYQAGAVESDSPAAVEEKEKKKAKAKAKQKKEEKKVLKVVVEQEEGKEGKKGEKTLNVYVTEDECGGKAKKKIKKIICLPGKANIEKIKIEGGHLVIYEKGKPVKKIKLETKECKDITVELKGDKAIAFIGEGAEGDEEDIEIVLSGKLEDFEKAGKHVVVTCKDGKKDVRIIKGDDEKMVWVGKDGKKTFNILKKGDGDEDVHVVMKKGIMTTGGDKNVWVMKKGDGEGEEEEKVFKIKTGDKDGDTKIYKIKTRIHDDGELQKKVEALQKSMANLEKEFKAKSPKQEKVLQELEEVLKKLEQELEKKEKHKKIDVFVTSDDDELIDIAEGDKKHVFLKQLKEKDLLSIPKDGDIHIKLKLAEKINKKQKKQIKKAVAKLEKSLPKSFEVKAEITGASQEISIKSGDEGCKKGDSVMQEVEKFQAELEKIVPGLKEKKKMRKKIRIEKKEQKK